MSPHHALLTRDGWLRPADAAPVTPFDDSKLSVTGPGDRRVALPSGSPTCTATSTPRRHCRVSRGLFPRSVSRVGLKGSSALINESD